MASPPAPLAVDAYARATVPAEPSLKSALLIVGGLLLLAVAAIVLLRCLLRRWASSSHTRPRRASSEVDAVGGEARRGVLVGRDRQADAGVEEGQTRMVATALRDAEAGPARVIATALRDAEPGPARVIAAAVEEEVEAHPAREQLDDETGRLIASLPLFTMASALAALPRNSPDCAVCLSPFDPGAELRLLPACRHAFHASCIDAWLRTNPVCPICRRAVSSPAPPLPVAAAAGGQELLGTRTSSRSFRVELGSVSDRRSSAAAGDERRTYSLGGSFDYRVDEEVEVIVSRIVRPAAARPRPAAGAPGEALAEEVGSPRGWLGEYLDRVAASVTSLSGRWSGRPSLGCRHDDSTRWDPEAAAVAAVAKSATPAALTNPSEALVAGSRGRLGEYLDRLASSASSLSGRWSGRWNQGHQRGEPWQCDTEAARRAADEEEPALVGLGRWIFGL